jgi:CheY-like chemotaxis protein
VRNLVTLHGGRVQAHSEGLGKGTELTVRLPAPRGEALVAEHGYPSPPPPSSGASSHRILVVDDNKDAAEMIALALATGGYTTRVSHNGPQALLAVDDFPPDLAVLDIGLPVMDGYELARRLRASMPDRRVQLVAVTGYGQPEDLRRAREAGFDEHLVKPVDVARLHAVVSRLLATPARTP